MTEQPTTLDELVLKIAGAFMSDLIAQLGDKWQTVTKETRDEVWDLNRKQSEELVRVAAQIVKRTFEVGVNDFTLFELYLKRRELGDQATTLMAIRHNLDQTPDEDLSKQPHSYDWVRQKLQLLNEEFNKVNLEILTAENQMDQIEEI